MLKNANSTKSSNFSVNKRSLQCLFGIPGVIFYDSCLTDGSILLFARLRAKSARCPCCGKLSKRVHSIYKRHLKDLPSTEFRVHIVLYMRKFRCNNGKCKQRIFSEQNLSLTQKYSRRTSRATEFLKKLLVETSSRKGEYLTHIFSIKQSSSTCLRIVKSIQIPDDRNLTIIGIDDWAYRKGLSYGTIIVNAVDHRPVELLKSRTKEDVIEWLKDHDSVTHVTRDRASSYSNAISIAAPKAMQIADKFHLIKNLGDHITDEIRKQYQSIKSGFISQNKESVQDAKPEIAVTNQIIENQAEFVIKRLVKDIDPRREALFNEVHRLKDASFSQRSIAKTLGIDRTTVRNYCGMKELLPKRSSHNNNYEDFIGVICECCDRGMSVKNIFTIIEQQGFNGKLTAFYEWFNTYFDNYKYKGTHILEQCKIAADPIVVKFNLMSPTRLAIHVTNPLWGISRNTGKCSEYHILAEQIISSSTLLTEMRNAYISFREVLNGDDASALSGWISEYNSTIIKKLKTFINGLNHDIEAVRNAIKFEWTNGLVEGHVNRLKNKKREMYGRASFELLKRKVILSKTG